MRRSIGLVTVLLVVTAACGVTTDSGAQRIEPGELGGLGDSLPTTTTTTTPSTTVPMIPTTEDPTPTTSPVQTQSVQLYFINSGKLIPVSVQLAGTSPTVNQIMASLQSGVEPGNPLFAGLRSAVPTVDGLLPTVSDDGSGVVVVDLPGPFFDNIQTNTDILLAVGQIVLSLLKSSTGIGQVLFQQLGEPISVPKADGTSSQPGETVSIRDYTALLADSPATPTTTTATTSSVTGAA